MKKYLFIALAAFGLVACTDNWNDPNSPNFKGELEESYIAINLMSADLESRALEGDTFGYEDGTTEERKITTAYFFFFDENGNPFNVLGGNTGATAPDPGQQAKNYLQLTIGNTTGQDSPNVSDIKNAVLVLNTYKGVYPSKIVAVLNWTPEAKAYSLENLHDELATLGNESYGFVMSNSVYMDGAGNIVDAVPLTAANIKTSSTAALDAPVDIYVERIAAKVILTASGKVENSENIFDTQKDSTPIVTLGEASTIDVYVKLHGWELYNDYTTTNLLKDIHTTWTSANLGLTWNDIPYYRCYWAESQNNPHDDSFSWSYATDKQNEKGLPTQYGFNIASNNQYVPGTYAYCGENTNQVNGATDPRTKVILKGQLMKKDGESYEPLELARWYGTEYAGSSALKNVVANSLKYTLYYYDEGNSKYVSIAPEDLECVAGATVGAKAYEVGFQLSNTGASKIWYQYSSAEGYKVFGDTSVANDNKTKTNAYLATNVEPALLYTSGQTYYTIDIRHLGTNQNRPAYYGVVRNHVYKIDVKSIVGYGSPIYSGTSNIETPDYPTEDEASYVAARINVLSWKVVKQGVDIVQ